LKRDERLLLVFAPALLLLLAACGGGSSTTATTAPTGTTAASTTAVADYYIVPAGVQLQAAALFTLNITQTIPSGDKTTWYTYTGGQWTSLGPATVFGGTPSIAQGSFSPVPTNLVVLASSQ
jgi:hypothetical protein